MNKIFLGDGKSKWPVGKLSVKHIKEYGTHYDCKTRKQ